MDATFLLGQHSAQLVALAERSERTEVTVNSMNEKLDTIVIALAERKAERRTIAAVATAAGGVGSFLMSLLLKS
jgi:hypothetical protein